MFKATGGVLARGLRKTQMKKSTETKFDLMQYFKDNMTTDSHMQNAPKKLSPYKNDSSQRESYWNPKNLLQNVDNSSKSFLHGVERSRERSRSVEHLHETPPKRSREESSGKSSEKSPDEKRSKYSHHSHSTSPKREGSRMQHSPGSLEYSNESFQKMSENRSWEESRGKSSKRSRKEKRSHHSNSKSHEREKSRTPHSPKSVQYSNESPPRMSKEKRREDSRGKSREKSPQGKRIKHSHSKSPKRERSQTQHSPRSCEKRRRSRSNSGSSRGSTHEIHNQKVPARSPKGSISPILFDASSNSSKGEDEDFKSRKLYKEDSLKLIKQDGRMDKKEHFHFFFGKDSPFSNFHSAAFEVQGIWYRCSEQFMMHQKAVLFDDAIHADRIMRATDPREMKKLGRKVEQFNPYVWGMKSEKIVKVGIKAKFEQNEGLKEALIATFPRILVEAAPRDRLWGIGMGSLNNKAYCRLTWRGQNKLGYLLTNIRNEIMEEEGLFSEPSGV